MLRANYSEYNDIDIDVDIDSLVSINSKVDRRDVKKIEEKKGTILSIEQNGFKYRCNN